MKSLALACREMQVLFAFSIITVISIISIVTSSLLLSSVSERMLISVAVYNVLIAAGETCLLFLRERVVINRIWMLLII